MSQSKGSRLQKLLLLLEGGSSPDIRKAAARQIVDIAKTHPQQLPSVIRKIHACLYHKQWDARVAAGDAFALLSDAFPNHTAAEVLLGAGIHAGHPTAHSAPTPALVHLDIKVLLEKGTALLASGGQEFDMVLEPGLTPKQRLEKQRQLLKQRLGLQGKLETLVDTDDLLQNEDIDLATARINSASQPKQAAADVIMSMEGLSARERNRLKRKAKAMNRTDSLRNADSLNLPRTGSMRPPSGGGASSDAQGPSDAAVTDEVVWADVSAGGWVLQYAADQMVVDLLDPVWEVRHGAAVGLRELLRCAAGSAGFQEPVADETSGWMMAGGTGKRRLRTTTPEEAGALRTSNASWLEECVLLLLAVLALDHFADYGSDQVTAPVRETAAQALAFALSPLSPDTVMHILSVLEQLQKHNEWAVRYGGYLGVKYLMAARLDMATVVLPRQMPLLITGLQDSDDDVIGASATALIPVVTTLESLGPDPIQRVTGLIWQQLQQLDALSPASAGCLQLLACLYDPHTLTHTSSRITGDLATLIHGLWPYLHHSLTSVRASAALCLERLLAGAARQGEVGWVGACGGVIMQHVFQRLLIETVDKVREGWVAVWEQLLRTLTDEQARVIAQGPTPAASTTTAPAAAPPAAGSATGMLHALFRLAATPAGQAFQPDLLLIPPDASDAAVGNAVAAAAAAAKAGGDNSGPSKRRRTAGAGSKAGLANGSAAAPPQTALGAAANGAAPVCGWRALTSFVVGQQGDTEQVTMRLVGAKALAALCAKLSGQGGSVLTPELILACLTDPAAAGRQLAALTLWFWMASAADPGAPQRAGPCAAPPVLSALQTLLGNASACRSADAAYPLPYAETGEYYTQLRREVIALIGACMNAGWLLHTPNDKPPDQLLTDEVSLFLTQVPATSGETVLAAQQRVESLNTSLATFEQHLHLTTLSASAGALVRTGQLPNKLNLVLQPLMASLRKEPEPRLQSLSGEAVAELLLITAPRTPSPNEKLVKNICAMACGDPAEVPSAASAAAAAAAAAAATAAAALAGQDTQLLERQRSHAKASTSQANIKIEENGSSSSAPGGAEAEAAAAAIALVADAAAAAVAALSPEAVAARVSRVGAEAALAAMCKVFGEGLFGRLQTLWQFVSGPLSAAEAVLAAPAPATDQLQALINSMQVLRVIGPHVTPSLVPTLLTLLPHVITCTACANAAVRQAAARCMSALAAAWLTDVMPPLLTALLPRLNDLTDAEKRLGAVEVVSQLTVDVGGRLAPYVVLLVVPLLRRMSDSHPDVRAGAARCFGALVGLVPLAQGCALPPGLNEKQLAAAAQDSAFLVQLLDNKRAEDFPLPVSPSVTLRPYQQEGVNWLAFLKRFGLHGVLADDMGLGKTLQTSCIMASALVEQESELKRAKAEGQSPRPLLPCLVVCPSTLVQHWVHEITRFLDASALRPAAIAGGPADRAAACRRLDAQWAAAAAADGGFGESAANVVVISYEHLKSEITWASSRQWLYVVLDEGHMIKSHKTKIAQACRRLTASHRLILSGTPIQNSVLELWSLFDFLMPGFLGTERDFNAKYGKALKAAKYSKKGSSEAEAGLLAVDALHKQVMPFILRRTKAQVLSDLPPKIIQDIYCDMSPLQAALYEDFQSSKASEDAASALRDASQGEGMSDEGGSGGSGGGTLHVFQALQYMRRLCSHPALVLNMTNNAHRSAVSKVFGGDMSESAVQSTLRDVTHAPKLEALRELLVQCGLVAGEGDGRDEDEDTGGSSAGHRLLVFAQLKTMLDLVERDVLVPAGVSFLRLDGSVEASQRFGIVQRFNSDPTIDVLLLTTSVGGLGLNLTSADTVVFLEHDWNPMKDLQAMDRAHRLGQTRTVNVYRLLMRHTLEERIMGLQKFKIDVANAVVSQDNASLNEMDTGKLLDLFEGSAATAAAGTSKETDKAAKKPPSSGLQSMLASMGELWDEEQYEQQFNMGAFMKRLDKRGDKGGKGGGGS